MRLSSSEEGAHDRIFSRVAAASGAAYVLLVVLGNDVLGAGLGTGADVSDSRAAHATALARQNGFGVRDWAAIFVEGAGLLAFLVFVATLWNVLRRADERGPLPAVAWAAGLAVELEVSGERNGIPAGLDVAGYRIVQEALTNVLKHAHASRAAVSVASAPDRVSLAIVDNGIGCQGGASLAVTACSGCASAPPSKAARSKPMPPSGGGFAVRATLHLHGGAA